jgi:fluoroquinolone resistance protein
MLIKKSNKASVKTYHNIVEKIDFTATRLEREYESTLFRSCVFNDISGVNFTDCLFESCNLSNAEVGKCKAQDITFKDCKLIGINFYQILDFGLTIQFENCMLDYASFDKKKMNKSAFKNCRLHGVNFSQTDLSKVEMVDCDLLDAIFDRTNLSGMNFTTNRNFVIDPQLNLVKKARFSASNLSGLLAKFDLIIE